MGDGDSNPDGENYTSNEEDDRPDLSREDTADPRFIPDWGGCYITTACIGFKGLPDDCCMMTTLRNFREMLNKTVKGRAALKEYDVVGPRIVQAIAASGNPAQEYAGIYRDLAIAVSNIEKKDFEGAFSHYKAMTGRLQKRYL